ncbi:hypothetical protein D3C85_925800 [compost metagenome]
MYSLKSSMIVTSISCINMSSFLRNFSKWIIAYFQISALLPVLISAVCFRYCRNDFSPISCRRSRSCSNGVYICCLFNSLSLFAQIISALCKFSEFIALSILFFGFETRYKPKYSLRENSRVLAL